MQMIKKKHDRKSRTWKSYNNVLTRLLTIKENR